MNRKNTLIGIFIIIALLAIAFVAYQFIFDTIKQEIVDNQTRELTEKEKLLQKQGAELDALREQYRTHSTSSATSTLPSQIKTMDALHKKTTSIVTKKSVEQQARELDALRATLNK